MCNALPFQWCGDWCKEYILAFQPIIWFYDLFVAVILTADMMKQSLLLAKRPHIVVATPGRLADHLQSTDTMVLDKIKFLVSNSAQHPYKSNPKT